MSTKEILEKEVLDINDLKNIVNIGSTKAYQLMREIKNVSDRLKIRGRIHIKDYQEYIDRQEKKALATAIANVKDGITNQSQC